MSRRKNAANDAAKNAEICRLAARFGQNFRRIRRWIGGLCGVEVAARLNSADIANLRREIGRQVEIRRARAEARAMRPALSVRDRLARRREAMARERQAAGAATAEQVRRVAFAELRRLGFRREAAGASGSAYYERRRADGGIDRVRVSDHDVPGSPERDAAGFSWATHGLTLRIDEIESPGRVAEAILALGIRAAK